MGIVILVFSGRIRAANRKLKDRNKQIEEINSQLKKTNKNLSLEKENIAREFSYSEMFYKSLIHSADDGISFFDRDGNLKFANLAYYSIIGMTREQYNAIGNDYLLHPEDTEYEKMRTEALIEKGFFEYELRLKHKDGHFITLSTKSVTVKNDNGDVIGAPVSYTHLTLPTIYSV